MGRKAAAERQHTKPGSTASKVCCTYCGLEFSSEVAKIKAHLAPEWYDGKRGIGVCSKAPQKVRDSIQAVVTSEWRKKKAKQKRKREDAIDEAEGKTLNQKQGKIHKAFQSAEKDIVDKAIGKFFYANGIAFNAADSEEYRNMIVEVKKAGSAYKPPGREPLRTSVLRKVRNDLDAKLRLAGVLPDDEDEDLPVTKAREVGAQAECPEVEAEAPNVSFTFGKALCSDGWSSTTNRPLLNVITVSTKGAYFVKSIDTSGETKSAGYQEQQDTKRKINTTS